MSFWTRRNQRQREEIDRTIREAMRSETERVEGVIASLQQANTTLTTQLSDARRERDDLKAKLRQQTEADLVLTSLKIVALAIKGEPRDSELEQRNRLLQAQMSALGASHYGAGGLLGGIGIGNLGPVLSSMFHSPHVALRTVSHP